MSTEKPQSAFIIHLDNKKKFAFSYALSGDKNGNVVKKLVIMFGHYTDDTRSLFNVVKIKKFKESIDPKYSESDLNNPKIIEELLAPYIEDIKQRSLDIKEV